MSLPTPKELDAQSKIQLDGWVDLDSEEWRQVDDLPALTKKAIKLLMTGDPQYLFTDLLGRVWGKGEDNCFYPFHVEYGSKKFGIRMPKKAAN